MKLTDDQRAELVAIINREGGAPGHSLHSWRCEDKVRYPEPCRCVEGLVDELAQVIVSWLAEVWDESYLAEVEHKAIPNPYRKHPMTLSEDLRMTTKERSPK